MKEPYLGCCHIGAFDNLIGAFDNHIGAFDNHIGAFNNHIGAFNNWGRTIREKRLNIS
jgi:hypothetical protein